MAGFFSGAMAPASLSIEEEDGVTRVVMRHSLDSTTTRLMPMYTISLPVYVPHAVWPEPHNRPQYIGQQKDSTHVPFYRNLPKFKRRR